jgi:two-component system, cell cycle sensor histidine kinase and response regulator CckA
LSSHAVGASQESEPQSLTALADAGQWCGPETILLVEDEAFVRKATAEALGAAGYRLLIAKSAAEALEACRNCFPPVDLLLTDVVMPGMSGPDLAAEFQSLYPRARTLLMSGHAGQFAGRELSGQGNQCLAKPFSIRALLRSVREVLDANPLDQRPQA